MSLLLLLTAALIGAGLMIGAALIAAVLWASGGSLGRGPSRRALTVEILDVSPRPRARPGDELVIVSWNIAWAFGAGSEMRPGTPAKPKEAMDRALEEIGRGLAGLDPDVALLQEVDFSAKRSFFVDQAAALGRAAGLPFLVRGLSWDVRYLPFPPGNHAGPLKSGGAILSRFPLADGAIELIPKPERRGPLFRLFYLYRYFLSARLEAFGRRIPLLTCHLEAFDAENRALHAARLEAMLRADPDPLRIVAGDLNSVPPEAPLAHDYPDEPKTDHRGERVIPSLRAIPGLIPVFPPEALQSEPSSFLSFPAHAPNRLLDHGFVGTGFEIVEARVAREVGAPSDHLPIVFRLRLR